MTSEQGRTLQDTKLQQKNQQLNWITLTKPSAQQK
jgi:hypothetical protein